MVQGIVDGATTASVKGAGAVVRGAQSGFVRAYALLSSAGSRRSASTSWWWRS